MSYKITKEKLLATWQGKAEAEKMALAFKLSDILKQKGLKNKEFAEKLGTSNAYVTKLLRGDQNLSIESIHRIASVLNFDVCIELIPLTEAS